MKPTNSWFFNGPLRWALSFKFIPVRISPNNTKGMIKEMKKILVATAIALTLAGCASSGNQQLSKETEVSVKSKLQEGKTTKAEVRQYFGAPDSGHTTVTASGKESWYYSVDKGINLVSLAGSMIPVTGASQAADAVDKSSQKDSNSLMIFFDEKGVVENWVR